MKTRKEEETRNEMRRLNATDDPREMAVSLRPQNKQLSIKMRKKVVKQEQKSVSRGKHNVKKREIVEKRREMDETKEMDKKEIKKRSEKEKLGQ